MNARDEFQYAKALQKKLPEAYQCANEGKYLYHYATRETFWNILDSDLFFARHIRFSNDSVEYEIGKNCVAEFMGLHSSTQMKLMEEINHCYMVCLCGAGDLLSQWRGYAQGGVAIGLDFQEGIPDEVPKSRYYKGSGQTYCTILNNAEAEKRTGDRFAVDRGKKEVTVKVTAPYHVQYVDGDCNLEDAKENQALLAKLNAIWTKVEEENRRQQLIQYIPYIKDRSFEEEEEYRMIFNLQSLGGSFAHSSMVRSSKVFYMDADGIKKPTIKVQFGNAEEKVKPVGWIYIGSGVSSELYKKIKRELRQSFKGEHKLQCTRYHNRAQQKNVILIGDGNNQREIFEKIETILEAENSETKIWCDGHLPIREIIVGPSSDQKNMIESIRNYVCDKYWLKNVSVSGSKIPLRMN